jgi:hypothetical protein
MIGKARAEQLRRMTSVLQIIFCVYVLFVQGHVIHRPSHSVKIYIFLGMIVIFAGQGYALWIVRKWNKLESIPQG